MWQQSLSLQDDLDHAHPPAQLTHRPRNLFRLPDDGSGALPLIPGIILNDDKSSTYKLALLRAIAKIADTMPALGRPYPDEEVVDVPLGLVSLNWVRMYLRLVSAGLPRAPQNSAVGGLGFAKTGFQALMSPCWWIVDDTDPRDFLVPLAARTTSLPFDPVPNCCYPIVPPYLISLSSVRLIPMD
jgi:hypothetical protein